ncbi:MAG TPA: NAD(P)H-hydrate dehydratase [Planctomycetota bacterium]|nr:NAD(P)H-hydrate dehydratase [Planctomycetota bacterium]
MDQDHPAMNPFMEGAPPPLLRWMRDSHKGDHGHVLIVGGSVGLAGAPVLAAEAALRLGAGRVSLSVPGQIYEAVAASHPELMVTPLASTQSGHLSLAGWAALKEQIHTADAILIGPGLGRHPRTEVLVQRVLCAFEGPVVVDADALIPARERPPRDSRIFTPHLGEAARLLGFPSKGFTGDRREILERLFALLRGTVVLKGPGTLVRGRGGVWQNSTGSPSLGRGGSGDVLAGMIVALAAQGLDGARAAATGVYLHGLAADRLLPETGDRGLHPKRLLDGLPQVVCEWENHP